MTKKILVALALFPMVASANVSPGALELSGNSSLGFTSGSFKVDDGTTSATADTTDYGVGVSGLYYVTPNVGIGATLQYDSTKEEAGGVEFGVSNLLVGPAIGVDFPIAPQLSFFGRGAVGYASQTVTQTGDPDFSPSGYGFTVEAGVKYFFAKAFSVDAGLGYDWVKVEESPVEITTSGFGVNVGLSVYFGNR